MEIAQFSKERGIYGIFQGYGDKAYIIYSTFYGAVGYADIHDEIGSKDITVNLYLCEGSKYWYWSLKNIVMRGIRKLENQFVSKKIKFNVEYIDSSSSIGELSVKLELYKE